MLGCIAAGKWVLHPSYLDDSLAAGIWLQVASKFLQSIEKYMKVCLRKQFIFKLIFLRIYQDTD